MKDHEKRELINKLRDIAVQFAHTQQLRQRIAEVVLDALAEHEKEQRPEQTIQHFAEKLAAEQEPLGYDAAKVLYDNLPELYAKSETKKEGCSDCGIVGIHACLGKRNKEQEPMKQKTDLLFSTATMQDRHDAMLGRLEKTLERVKQEAQQKEQEPVAYVSLMTIHPVFKNIKAANFVKDVPIGTELYTAPPQREWVGLTDEEIKAIAATPAAVPGSYVYAVARAIEQALKEKNT